MDLWSNLMEETFFFMYHLHRGRKDVMQMPINERKWVVERFIQQKERENEALEAAKRKSKNQ
jgi:hypothetical protein